MDEGVRAIAGEREFKRSHQTMQRSDAAMIMKNENVKYLRLQLLRINALSAVLSMMLREDRAGVQNIRTKASSRILALRLRLIT